MEVKKMTDQRPHCCTVPGCNKTYLRAYHLRRHVASCHEHSKTSVCPYEGCGRVYSLPSNLKRHLKTHDTACPYKCEMKGCGFEAKKKQGLLVHLSLVHGDKQFKCTIEGCKAVFSLPSELKRHTKRHLKEYRCDTCSVVCSSWTLLRRHKAAVHSNNKHVCHACGVIASTSKQLELHLQTHNDTRQLFTCPFESCERTYTTKFNLDQHVKSFHEKLKPFPCPRQGCSSEFAHKYSLIRHISRCHPADNETSKTSGVKLIRTQKRKVMRSLAEEISGHVEVIAKEEQHMGRSHSVMSGNSLVTAEAR